MPIKKFKLTYSQVPKVFSIKKEVFLKEIAESIPEEVLDQTEKQKKQIADTISQLELDFNRTAYVDIDGHKTSELKADWVTWHLDGQPTLTTGVFPSFTQGTNTGRCVGEIVHSLHFLLPLNETDSKSFVQVHNNTQKIAFAYRTASGEAAGFSLLASVDGDDKGQHKGWIISTIQNSTGHPQEKNVTVLASPNYTTSKARSMVAMDNPARIEAELKAAINNDKIVNLIKGIFNPDGSLNKEYINSLNSRIKESINIDNRDWKEDQLNCLFELSKQIDSETFQTYVTSVQKQMTEDIDFFKEGLYESHLKDMLHQLAVALRQNLKANKTVSEITLILKIISERVASLEKSAEENYRKIELSNTYKALAKRLNSEAATLKLDRSRKDENKIVLLSQFDVSRVNENVAKFYATDPAIPKYYGNKKQSNQEMQEKQTKLTNPAKERFFSRNVSAIGFGLVLGLLVGVAVGLAFTGVLAPVSVALIAVGTALVVSGAISGVDIYSNEKKHTQEVNQYKANVATIRLEHDQELLKAEEELQKGINLDSFLEPDKPEFLSQIKVSKRKPLTPESVAHALWLNDKGSTTTSVAKNRFSVWAAKQENLGFGIEEVESVIDKRFEMQS